MIIINREGDGCIVRASEKNALATFKWERIETIRGINNSKLYANNDGACTTNMTATLLEAGGVI